MVVASRGSTEHLTSGFFNVSIEKPLNRIKTSIGVASIAHAQILVTLQNEVSTSLAMPVAMSLRIDEARVTGWFSVSCLTQIGISYTWVNTRMITTVDKFTTSSQTARY